MLIVLVNLFNLIAGLYLFFLATTTLIFHNNIKEGSNTNPDVKITDFDIRLIGGLFAYLSLYFFWNFGAMTFFGIPI